MSVSVEIQVKSVEDFELLIEILKTEEYETPVYIIQSSECYYFNFEASYNDNQIEYKLRDSIEGFEFTEHLRTGVNNIRLKIRRSQHGATDGWGRPIDPFDSTVYLVAVEKSDEDFNQGFKALFHDEIRHYSVNVAQGRNPKTDARGFLVVDNETDERQVIINKLFETKIKAFWAGFQNFTENIQEEFDSYIRKKRRKRKVKD